MDTLDKIGVDGNRTKYFLFFSSLESMVKHFLKPCIPCSTCRWAVQALHLLLFDITGVEFSVGFFVCFFVSAMSLLHISSVLEVASVSLRSHVLSPPLVWQLDADNGLTACVSLPFKCLVNDKVTALRILKLPLNIQRSAGSNSALQVSRPLTPKQIHIPKRHTSRHAHAHTHSLQHSTLTDVAMA